MINKQDIEKFMERTLEGQDLFLVDVSVSPDNVIEITIESSEGVTIDNCVELTQAFEAEFDRDKEDYELTVGSAGLTTPFKVLRQYQMHIGEMVEVLANDGRKYRGTLDAADAESFTLIVAEKVRKEGLKKPVIEDVSYTFNYENVKYTKNLLQF